ncbi:hypothetical protein C8J57DRAFT_1213824 [Mycena rebaudengoi]|nr:hypothetical protein C8J57DRAFT_1213824 [Mycena rebaudengoi]
MKTVAARNKFKGQQSSTSMHHLEQVVGTRVYSSNYIAIGSPQRRGVANQGFLFHFWPYGSADNATRPGGALTTAAFCSNATDGSIFRILSDNATLFALLPELTAVCSSYFNTYVSPVVFNPSESDASMPRPEQVVLYYRASSFALTLDGYNNTAIFEADDPAVPDSLLPTEVTNTDLPNCLSATIAKRVPLIDEVESTVPFSSARTQVSSHLGRTERIFLAILGGILLFLLFLLVKRLRRLYRSRNTLPTSRPPIELRALPVDRVH